MKIGIDQLARQLESDLGVDALGTDPTTRAAHNCDGKQPTLVLTPAAPEQFTAAVRVCAAAGATLVPWGGGTAMSLGNPPVRVDAVIATTRMNRLIEHDHANLTVTAESGITLSMLQAALMRQTQFLPVDPPFPDRATIGGTVAANLNGPRRNYYGSLRDLVIGMRIVLGSGNEIKAGGKVVKNVAGYDMSKLFIGSIGTLGIITELTMRVSPLPECSATILGAGTLHQALQLADDLTHSKLLPSAVNLRIDAESRIWQLAIRFEGFDSSVARQLGALGQMAQSTGILAEVCRGRDEQQIWQALGDFPLQPDRVIYRITAPLTSLVKLIDQVLTERPGGLDVTISADLAMGVLWIATPANKVRAGEFAALTACARQHRGHAVIFQSPPELKAGVEVWGPSPPTLSLMREVKQQFDPMGILNTGRFVGGL